MLDKMLVKLALCQANGASQQGSGSAAGPIPTDEVMAALNESYTNYRDRFEMLRRGVQIIMDNANDGSTGPTSQQQPPPLQSSTVSSTGGQPASQSSQGNAGATAPQNSGHSSQSQGRPVPNIPVQGNGSYDLGFDLNGNPSTGQQGSTGPTPGGQGQVAGPQLPTGNLTYQAYHAQYMPGSTGPIAGNQQSASSDGASSSGAPVANPAYRGQMPYCYQFDGTYMPPSYAAVVNYKQQQQQQAMNMTAQPQAQQANWGQNQSYHLPAPVTMHQQQGSNPAGQVNRPSNVKPHWYADAKGSKIATPVPNPAYSPLANPVVNLSAPAAIGAYSPMTGLGVTNLNLSAPPLSTSVGSGRQAVTTTWKDWEAVLDQTIKAQPYFTFQPIREWKDDNVKHENWEDEWTSYFSSFIEACASHNHEAPVAASFLCSHVTGTAARGVLVGIPANLRRSFNYVANRLNDFFCPAGSEQKASMKFENLKMTSEPSYASFLQVLQREYSKWDSGRDPARREMDLKRRFILGTAHMPESNVIRTNSFMTDVASLVAIADTEKQTRLCLSPKSNLKPTAPTTQFLAAQSVTYDDADYNDDGQGQNVGDQGDWSPSDPADMAAFGYQKQGNKRITKPLDLSGMVCSYCYKKNHDYDHCWAALKGDPQPTPPPRAQSPHPAKQNQQPQKGRSPSKSPNRGNSGQGQNNYGRNSRQDNYQNSGYRSRSKENQNSGSGNNNNYQSGKGSRSNSKDRSKGQFNMVESQDLNNLIARMSEMAVANAEMGAKNARIAQCNTELTNKFMEPDQSN